MKWYKKIDYNFALLLFVGFLAISIISLLIMGRLQERAYIDGMKSKGKVIALSGAKMISVVLEGAVQQNQITAEDLFSSELLPLENTSPQKFTSRYDELTDRLFPPIQEAFMSDEEVVFAAAAVHSPDQQRTGYIPTHNLKYSRQASAHGEKERLMNRTKRVFNDETGARAVANTTGVLEQHYRRDTGEEMWDISAPISVYGRHWGAFRVGFSKETVYGKLAGVRLRMIGMFALFILFISAIAIVLLRRITRPIIRISDHARLVSGGDLSVDLAVPHGDNEIGDLVENFNRMISNFKFVLRQLKEVIDTIDFSGEKLRGVMNGEATAINQQTAAMTETTSTMEELTTIAQEIEENSRSILDSLADNIHIASESRAVLDGFLETMDAIARKNQAYAESVADLKEKSRRIEEVMSIIDGIADQTKLIAFNATIEAVGSGEMGKRFSIVAEEIRRLANNVMQSTSEIKSKIGEMQAVTDSILEYSREETEEIRRGVQGSRRAGESFDRVVAMSESSHALVKNITQSIIQQKDATEQVLSAIKDISEGALVLNEKVSENLDHVNAFSGLSNKLKALISQFKL